VGRNGPEPDRLLARHVIEWPWAEFPAADRFRAAAGQHLAPPQLGALAWRDRLARRRGSTAVEAATVGTHSPFTASLLAALGKPERPANLLSCLGEMAHDPTLTRQGFRTLGGIDPNLTLWSTRTRVAGVAGASSCSSAATPGASRPSRSPLTATG